MHEYAVTESVLDIIQAEAARAGARRIGEVTLVIGELSSFVDTSIELYFGELSRGTMAEGAQLVFRRIEARAECLDCGAAFRPLSTLQPCPECHSPLFRIDQGQEFYVDSIDVD